MRKLTMLISGAVGYVLGTRAGRERYEQIKNMATRVKEDPRVQEKAQQATDLAKEKAPVVKDKVSGAADAARSKVSGDGASADQFPDDSLLNQEEPYPKGDLP
ncbi:MAG TPA: YtxH domain-containing protein [Nocardioides sp.]|nr:YtxH domain-containing protein [Nocardioides sp.]